MLMKPTWMTKVKKAAYQLYLAGGPSLNASLRSPGLRRRACAMSRLRDQSAPSDPQRFSWSADPVQVRNMVSRANVRSGREVARAGVDEHPHLSSAGLGQENARTHVQVLLPYSHNEQGHTDTGS